MQYLKQQYKEIGRFISKDLRFILPGTVVFFIAIIILAHAFILNNPELQNELMNYIRDNVVGDISLDGGMITAADLFRNNILACLVTVVIGLVPFLFLPVVSLFMNAAVLGVLGAVYQYRGMSVAGMYLFGIMPHGLFEFPALLISMAMGIHLCYCLVKRICEGRYNRGIVAKALANCLRTYMLLIVPLLVVAALIEANLTPILAEHFIF